MEVFWSALKGVSQEVRQHSLSEFPAHCYPVPPTVVVVARLLCGYLMKLGQHHKSWKERWFVMENGRLAYYKSKDMDRPIADIPLHDSYCRLSRSPSP